MKSNAYKTKIIKQRLKRTFPKVSVRSGTGTASGWIRIACDVPKDMLEDVFETKSKASSAIESIAQNALQHEQMDFSYYYADDGYNTKRSCVNVHVNVV